jgi:ribosome biogenesis GTPase
MIEKNTSETLEGRVIKSTGSWYHIIDQAGKIHKARLRGKFKKEKLSKTNPIAVGDIVSFTPNIDQERNGLITEIKDRKNFVERKSTHKGGHHGHMLAANLDLALLVVTVTKPKTSMGFIDRFLVACESSDVPAGIVFNKLDLIEDDEELEDLLFEYIATYRELGYQTFGVSALKNLGLKELEQNIANKVVLLAGHSGVGKSTLINTLIPGTNQQVGEVSEYANKGKHTTTFAELFFAKNDSLLIDTPGIKELGIINLDTASLDFFFTEFRKYAENCEFYDCTHTHEPKCSVISAVRAGDILQSRYNSYLSILENEDRHR